MSADAAVPPIHVIGVGLDGAAGLSKTSLRHVEAATVLVGSDRQLSYFPHHPGDRWSLNQLLDWLRPSNASSGASPAAVSPNGTAPPRVVVLASGDPLFFGVGRLLLQHLPPDRLLFHPHLSAVQMAFSRIKCPWQDAEVISAHGRSPEILLAALRRGVSRIAVLTDNAITPTAIAQMLLNLSLGDRYRIWVCEALGGEQEQVRCCQAADLAQEDRHNPLNVVILQRQDSLPPPTPPVVGIDDSQFASFPDRPGLMTKKPVRLVALGQLQLQNHQVVWDVGAGTGSVSIEAARLCPQSQIYAVEKSAAGASLICENAARFSVANIIPVCGRAPEGLSELPSPHRIFVGGSDGDLAKLLDIAQVRLQRGGILVAALATLDTMAIATQWLKARSPATAAVWNHQFLQVQLTYSVPVGPLTRFTPTNPVTLLTLHRS
ncbi:MAG: precorrin-6y C5,15-methyltransferase (decarboxylating) subunit CbiE [Elainellaceae cyanobacterium]